MVIVQNLSAMNAGRVFGMVERNNGKTTERLSSGYRINRSADDAAGLAISEKMRRQIRSLMQGVSNVQDGISLIQTAEGALHEVHHMLQRMNVLAIQASNGTNSDSERAYLQQEVQEIIGEIDKTATSTTFNDQILLDGRWQAKKEEGIQQAPKITVFDISYDITSAVKPMHSDVKPSEWSKVANVLQNEIVPQAITDLLGIFSQTFGYLNGVNIGIGLQMAELDDSPTVASVSMSSAYTMGTPAIVDLGYTLSVNMSFISMDDSGMITPDSRRNLESTIAHEMMHALMMESLTAGMAGRDENMNMVGGFPTWFIEGTAQAAGGGTPDVERRLRIDGNTEETDIQAALQNNRLGSGTGNSQYGTGYLAVMYLGYLANGTNSMEIKDIASGLDKILFDIRGGKSLSQSIADNTRGKYTGISDFESKFAQEGAGFSKNLLGLSANGFGALVGDTYSSNNILEDGTKTQPLFELYPNHATVYNEYKEGYDFLEGGLAESEGSAGAGHPNYNAGGDDGIGDGSTPGTGGDGSTPGTGGDGSTPGTGGDGSTPGTGGDGNTPGTGGDGSTPGTGGNGNTPGTGGGISKGEAIYICTGIDSRESIRINIDGINAELLGINKVDISTTKGALEAIDSVKTALIKVSAQRSRLGAYQNRLEHTVSNLENITENTMAAESKIRDADMARMMVAHANQQILLRTGQAMLANSYKHREGLLAGLL